jgi:S-adenosylhomocysteine hydrolase
MNTVNRKIRVAIVDDDPYQRLQMIKDLQEETQKNDALRDKLEFFGESDEFGDPRKIADSITDSALLSPPYDVVVADFVIPPIQEGGLVIARAIRSKYATQPAVPVLFALVTNHYDQYATSPLNKEFDRPEVAPWFQVIRKREGLTPQAVAPGQLAMASEWKRDLIQLLDAWIRQERDRQSISVLHQWKTDPLQRLPLLKECASKLGDDKPLRGKCVLIAGLHFLRNLVGFIAAMRQKGLDPSLTTIFYKDPEQYGYPAFTLVKYALEKDQGFDVQPLDRIVEWPQRLENDEKPLLVIEDGGFFAPAILQRPRVAARTVGVVEQTTHGLRKSEAAIKERSPQFPVISLPDSMLKSRFEPAHIGDATVQAVKAMLPHLSLRNMNAAVLGSGVIGSAVISALASQGVSVSFWDKDPKALVAASPLCGRVATSALDAVRNADLILGTTGYESITKEVIDAVRDNAWLASVSSLRVEIKLSYLRDKATSTELIPISQVAEGVHAAEPIGTRYRLNGKSVNVLADGAPLNFRGYGQMPDQAADLIMTLIFLAATELAASTFGGRKEILRGAVDELADKHGVCETYLKLLANANHVVERQDMSEEAR